MGQGGSGVGGGGRKRRESVVNVPCVGRVGRRSVRGGGGRVWLGVMRRGGCPGGWGVGVGGVRAP